MNLDPTNMSIRFWIDIYFSHFLRIKLKFSKISFNCTNLTEKWELLSSISPFYFFSWCVFMTCIIRLQCLRFLKREHLIDVTEVFRALKREKYFRLAKLIFYLLLFLIVIFRSVCIFRFLIPLNYYEVGIFLIEVFLIVFSIE